MIKLVPFHTRAINASIKALLAQNIRHRTPNKNYKR